MGHTTLPFFCGTGDSDDAELAIFCINVDLEEKRTRENAGGHSSMVPHQERLQAPRSPP
jgi:hypothetical protein